MKITVQAGPKVPLSSDLLVVPAYARGARGADIDPSWRAILPKSVLGPVRTGDFKGALGSRTFAHSPDGKPSERVLFVGLGPKRGVDGNVLRRYGGIAGRVSQATAGKKSIVLLPTSGKRLDAVGRTRLVAEGLTLGSYTFNDYRAVEGASRIENCSVLLPDSEGIASARKSAQLGMDLADGVNLARDVGNAPPNDLGPVELADRARRAARASGLKVRILDEKAIEKEGMGALLAVAQGSVRPARFIVLDHQPSRPDGRPPLVFVGKAITFDTGGISIKPGAGMADMKFDMCGGAAVLGAMAAIGKLKPKRRVIGLIPAAENMPGGRAYRPGDIIKSASGLTIEILNTDAEGRLALADGLHYAQRYEPDLIVDVATLTGACVIALGKHFSGAFSNDDKLCRKITEFASDSGEPMWPMPVTSDYVRQIRSDVADVKNLGGRMGGAITAAAFLSQFAGDGPWVHLDIAGTGNIDRANDLGPKGATGVAVRTLVELAERY